MANEKGFDPDRRHLVKLLLGSATGVIASRFIPPGIARAFPSAQRPWTANPDLEVIYNIKIGKTSDEEVNSLDYYKREEIKDTDLIRYYFASTSPNLRNSIYEPPFNIRPHLVITQKEKEVQSTRMWTRGSGAWVPTGRLKDCCFSGWPDPDAVIEPPDFYRTYRDPYMEGSLETLFESRLGEALVVAKAVRPGQDQLSMFEMYKFVPGMSLDEFRKTLIQEDYTKPTRKTVAILYDGLGSSSASARQRLGPLRDALAREGIEVIFGSYSDEEEYDAMDTYQDFDISAGKVRRKVDRVKNSSTTVKAAGYSLGGNVLKRYADNYIIPFNGPHKDGYMDTIVCVSSPLDGIPGEIPEIISIWSQIIGANQAGNEATALLTSLARDAQAREFTRIENINTARFLRNERAVNLVTLGNSSDRLMPEESFIIEGFGGSLNLGNDLINDNILSALIPPGRPEVKIGHMRMVEDPRGIAEIVYTMNAA